MGYRQFREETKADRLSKVTKLAPVKQVAAPQALTNEINGIKLRGLRAEWDADEGVVVIYPTANHVKDLNGSREALEAWMKAIHPGVWYDFYTTQMMGRDPYTDATALQDMVEEGDPIGDLSPVNYKRVIVDPLNKDAAPSRWWLQAVEGDREDKGIYLSNLWHHLNATKFGGQMRMPHIVWIKDAGAGKVRLLGEWRVRSRQLRVAPRLFNGHESILYETFLHEMCHQATWEVSKIERSEPNGGHGPVWKSWMVKVGLDPNRYAGLANDALLTDDEKTAAQERRDSYFELTKGIMHLSPVVEGARSRFLNGRKWVLGWVAYPLDSKKKKWAFIPDDAIEAGRFAYYAAPRLALFQPALENRSDKITQPIQTAILKVAEHIETKRQLQRARRDGRDRHTHSY